MAMHGPFKGAVRRLYIATPSPLKGAVGRLYIATPSPLKGAVGRLYSVASRGLLFERRRARHSLKEDVHVA
jgi:hypothetical protein